MAIRVVCPSCSGTYDIGDAMAGKTMRCRLCLSPFQVPGPAPTPPASVKPTSPASVKVKPPAPVPSVVTATRSGPIAAPPPVRSPMIATPGQPNPGTFFGRNKRLIMSVGFGAVAAVALLAVVATGAILLANSAFSTTEVQPEQIAETTKRPSESTRSTTVAADKEKGEETNKEKGEKKKAKGTEKKLEKKPLSTQEEPPVNLVANPPLTTKPVPVTDPPPAKNPPATNNPPVTNPPLAKNPPATDTLPVSNPPPVNSGQLTQAVLRKVKDATVYVRVKLGNGKVASGTGFFAQERGLLFTNAHVLDMLKNTTPPESIEVVYRSGEADECIFQPKILGVDPAADLAVLRVDHPNVPAGLEIKSAKDLFETQTVFVFGFPFGERLGKNVTVSSTSVSRLEKRLGRIVDIQVNGGMHPGNSGGPVINAQGEVIGVAVAGIIGTNINFAIPGDLVHEVLGGRVSGLWVQPMRNATQIKARVKGRVVDPFRKLKQIGLEYWVGAKGPERLPTDKPPVVKPGDSAHKTVMFDESCQGEIDLPELKGDEVYWLQPILVDTNDKRRWDAAHDFKPNFNKPGNADQFNPGFNPPGMYPPGGMPPGSIPQYPPGFNPGGSFPPGGYKPGGQFPPGGFNPGGSFPPGGYKPGGQFPPGGFNPGGSNPPGGFNPGGSFPPGGFNPKGPVPPGGTNPGGQFPSGGFNPGGSFPPGTVPPGPGGQFNRPPGQ